MKDIAIGFVIGLVIASVIGGICHLLVWLLGPWFAGILFFVGGLWLGFQHEKRKAQRQLAADLDTFGKRIINARPEGEL